MKCIRCGNEDERFFYNDQGIYYCRKCVCFQRVNVGDKLKEVRGKAITTNVDYELPFKLSEKQIQASIQIVEYLKQKQDVFVYAACGAGKSELSMEAIKYYLNQGKKVGFAISRRQVVLELQQRFQKAFKSIEVIAVCEGYLNKTMGDLIFMTMHQLYRYPNYFDLLIMDEVDAFPYRGNELLEQIARNACKGERLMLSATPNQEIKDAINKHEMAVVTLFERPHKHPLIVPVVIRCNYIMQIIYAIIKIKKWIKEEIPIILYTPTIKDGKNLYKLLRHMFNCELFTSKSENKEEILADFRKGNYDFLIATTILERGVTIPKVNIMVLKANHNVFDEASLIQISGRVGRSVEKPDGEGVFLCTKSNQNIKNCIKNIKMMNQS